MTIMLRLVECEMPYKHIDMALVRAVVTQASIWFIGIIIAQIYIQANFPGLAVRPFVRSSHKTSSRAERGHYRITLTAHTCLRECMAIQSGDQIADIVPPF